MKIEELTREMIFKITRSEPKNLTVTFQGDQTKLTYKKHVGLAGDVTYQTQLSINGSVVSSNVVSATKALHSMIAIPDIDFYIEEKENDHA